jgi:hypothetical protein
MEYRDFHIHIGKQRENGRFPITLLNSPEGPLVDDPILQEMPLAEPAFQAPIKYLSGLVARPEDTTQLGERLFNLLFSGAIWQRFLHCRDDARQAHTGLRIRLQIHKEEIALNQLPWEYAYYVKDNEFLTLTTPIVRYIERDYQPVTLDRPPRVLAALASPDHPGLASLNAQNEADAIKNKLAALSGIIELDLLTNTTYDRLQQKLHDGYDVLHFIGHGLINDAGQGALALEYPDNSLHAVDADQMQVLLRNRGLKLVMLTACETAVPGVGDIFKGMAQALVQGDIPAVIAMQFIVEYKTALTFAYKFYEYLSAGDPLDRALTEARIAAYGREKISWGIPVLFMQCADGVLWTQADAPDPADVAKTAVSRHRELAIRHAADLTPDNRLRDALFTLNFIKQVSVFDMVRRQQRAGAFLIAGPPDYALELGPYWLMGRLLKHLRDVSGGKVRKLPLSARSLGAGTKILWRRLAEAAGMARPFGQHKPPAIAEKVAAQLDTQHLVLVFDDVRLVHLETLRRDFWATLAKATTAIPAADTFLFMFLLDNENRVGADELPPIHPLPPLEPFSPTELSTWYFSSLPSLPPPLQMMDDAVNTILEESEGIPDLVLYYLDDLCADAGIIQWIKE